MAAAPIAADLRQPFDVHSDFTAEVALNLVVLIDDFSQPVDLTLRQILAPSGRADLGRAHDALAGRQADAKDVRQRDSHLLVTWNVDARDSCHSLSLLLLMFWIGANDEFNTTALNWL